VDKGADRIGVFFSRTGPANESAWTEKMELENLTLAEARAFLDQLSVPEEQFRHPARYALAAEFLVGARVDGELAGVAGVRRRLFVFPFCFYLVRPRSQNQGIGTQLMSRTLDYAQRRRYGLLALSVAESNSPAIALYSRSGFHTCARTGTWLRMCRHFNLRGKVMGRLLSLLFVVHWALLGYPAHYIRSRGLWHWV